MVRADPLFVPWSDRNILASELGVDPWALGSTFQHYAVEAWNLASEVKMAMQDHACAAALLQVLDSNWEELQSNFTSDL